MTNLQRGIAIAPILFVVALLAVVAMAIAAGTGAFSGDTSAVKIKAQATAILGYVDELQIGVDRVISRCPYTQISLANSADPEYIENPLAPTDKFCHVFDVNGGGVLFKEPPQGIDQTAVPPELRHYFINTANYLDNTGSLTRDLIITLPGISKELCLEINSMVGVVMESGDVPGSRAPLPLKVYNYWTAPNGALHTSCGGGVNWNDGRKTLLYKGHCKQWWC